MAVGVRDRDGLVRRPVTFPLVPRSASVGDISKVRATMAEPEVRPTRCRWRQIQVGLQRRRRALGCLWLEAPRETGSRCCKVRARRCVRVEKPFIALSLFCT